MTALSALVLVVLPKPGVDPVVADMLCEYLKSPLTVEAPAPRLSWTTRCSQRGWKQSAYQILVASDPKLLAPNQADLWDSGQVVSDASIQIPYAGKALTSRQRCFWKVRVWDAAGKPSAWSPQSAWEMGLLQDSDWGKSEWIGVESNSKEANPTPYLRKEFSINGKVKQARIYASGLGYAELQLNGKKVGGSSERDPGYSNFDKRALYVAHDVTSSLKAGTNALGAILGTGWFDVHDLATWRFEQAPWRGRPRLRLILVLEYADGRTETVVSDPTWKASTGPILRDGIYSGEIYDAQKEIPGWSAAGFDDHAWAPVSIMKAPQGKLAGRQCPPVEITQTIKAVRILEPKPGVYVVDFGQNIAGHVRLKVKAAAGTKITLNYSERIHPDGMVERSQIECYMNKTTPPQLFQTDTYICKGNGVEQWEQQFSYSGFQYVEVLGFPGKPSLDNFEARLANTAVDPRGEFSCSNDLLNKIQRATQYAYLSNAQSIPTDCPQREKNGWTGDAHLAAEAGLMNFKSGSFYTKWLDDVADDQTKEGGLSMIIPTGGWGSGACNPSWDSAFPIIAETMFEYEGDTHLLTKHYDHLGQYVDFLYGKTEHDLVPFDSLGDWLPWSTETPSKLTSTVMLFNDAKIVAHAAKLAGKAADAEKYTAIAEKVKAAYNKEYLTPEAIASSSQTALTIAVYFGLAEGPTRQAAFDALVKNVEKQGHIDTGIIGAKFILRVLSENGRTDLAYKLVARKEQPGWGWWIGQGATTLWEDWKGESSLNHIMFGDVSNWFFQWIAGIGLDPNAPAFKHVLIRPQVVGDLTWAKAIEHGPYGQIASSWKRDGGKFHLEIEIPANTTATVRVPGTCAAPEGLTVVKIEAGATLFEVGSGTYLFDSKL